MSSLIFKLKGPQRVLEIEIPVAGNGTVSALKKVLTDNEERQAVVAQQKKHWWQRSNSSTNEKGKGTSTALVLLASMILSALDE